MGQMLIRLHPHKCPACGAVAERLSERKSFLTDASFAADGTVTVVRGFEGGDAEEDPRGLEGAPYVLDCDPDGDVWLHGPPESCGHSWPATPAWVGGDPDAAKAYLADAKLRFDAGRMDYDLSVLVAESGLGWPTDRAGVEALCDWIHRHRPTKSVLASAAFYYLGTRDRKGPAK